MKNRSSNFGLLAVLFSILFSCQQSCPLEVGAIQYDTGVALLPGEEIPLKVEITNPDDCNLEINWLINTGTINPPNGSLNPVLVSACSAEDYRITLEVKDQDGTILQTRNLDLSTKEKSPLNIRDEYIYSGFFGDVNSVKVEEVNYQGKASEKFSYSPYGANGFAGVYYQYPPNNWGDQPGKDLSGYNKVIFKACSPDAALINFIAGGVSDSEKTYKDNFKGVTGFKLLSEDWQDFEIDLRNRDLSSVIGGLAWVSNRDNNSSPVTFYIADMQYIRENCPE